MRKNGPFLRPKTKMVGLLYSLLPRTVALQSLTLSESIRKARIRRTKKISSKLPATI